MDRLQSDKHLDCFFAFDPLEVRSLCMCGSAGLSRVQMHKNENALTPHPRLCGETIHIYI